MRRFRLDKALVDASNTAQCLKHSFCTPMTAATKPDALMDQNTAPIVIVPPLNVQFSPAITNRRFLCG